MRTLTVKTVIKESTRICLAFEESSVSFDIQPGHLLYNKVVGIRIGDTISITGRYGEEDCMLAMMEPIVDLQILKTYKI